MGECAADGATEYLGQLEGGQLWGGDLEIGALVTYVRLHYQQELQIRFLSPDRGNIAYLGSQAATVNIIWDFARLGRKESVQVARQMMVRLKGGACRAFAGSCHGQKCLQGSPMRCKGHYVVNWNLDRDERRR